MGNRAFMDVDSKSYCVYLDKSQELDCVCGDEESSVGGADGGDEEGYTKFTLPSSMVNGNASVASLKLHQCRSAVEVELDLRPLARPFYRLRVEDVEGDVCIKGVTLLAGDAVDLWFRNVNGTLRIGGDVACADCADGNDNNVTRPRLMVHIVDVGRVELENLMVGGDVEAKVKVRNVAGALRVRDSYFKSLPRDGLEVFNVAGGVEVRHSEFHDTTGGSVLLNGVRKGRSFRVGLFEGIG